MIEIRDPVLRNALGFGLGGVLTSVGLYLSFFVGRSLPPSLQHVVIASLFAFGGAVGGAFSATRYPPPPSGVRSGVCFGLAFLLAAPPVAISTVSLQGGVSLSYAALFWGIGFGVSGLVGAALTYGRFWAARTWKVGLAFVIGGAIGGPLGFLMFGTYGSMLTLAIGLITAFSIGGGLMGYWRPQ